jgi:hypothetical protein
MSVESKSGAIPDKDLTLETIIQVSHILKKHSVLP